MGNELVVIEKCNVMTVFTEQGRIDPILEKIAADARSIVYDVKTAKGRKEIASVAYRVAQSKTYLDGLGKELVAEMKELPKKVDASRKQVRDFLDALKDEVRKPLDDWDAEQAAIEAKRVAEEQAAKDAAQLESDHEIGLLMDDAFNRAAEDKRKATEQAQRDRDAALVQEAAAKAKADAEAAAQADKDASDKREREALLAKERAEQEAARAAQALKDAEAKAAQDKIDAEKREAEAKEKAAQELKEAQDFAKFKEEQAKAKAAQDLIEEKRCAELAAQVAEENRLAELAASARREQAAAQLERDKQSAEVQRLADEKAAREADTAHKAKINRAAVDAMIGVGITVEQAKAVLILVLKGKVPNVSINY